MKEPGLMTLDMLELQAEKFESLGSSDNATQLRAKLQSAQLYSGKIYFVYMIKTQYPK
jgi:hypothetical protein